MARGKCPHHPADYPCTCAMGHLYRFIEPVLLLMIQERGHAYGYDLSGDLGDYAFTDADIERAALYRTLNILEKNGYVKSHWDTKGSGPARKVYSLTKDGEHHLEQWAEVLHKVSKSMMHFVRKVEALSGTRRLPRTKRASAAS